MQLTQLETELENFKKRITDDLALFIGTNREVDYRYNDLITSIIITSYKGFLTIGLNDEVVNADVQHNFSVEDNELVYRVYCFDADNNIVEQNKYIGWDKILEFGGQYDLDKILLLSELRDLLHTLEHIDWLKSEIGGPAKYVQELPF